MRRLGDRFAFEHCLMLLVGLPRAVRRFVVVEQQEWLVVLAVLKPVQDGIGDQVGDIAFDRDALAHLDKFGVVIAPLPWEDFPIVKSRRLAFEMPLANHGGFVARCLHQLWKGLLRAIEGIAVGKLPVFVTVLSAQ